MRTRKTIERTIVLAWTVIEAVPDGAPYRRDLGERPRMIRGPVGRAATWLLRGTPNDVRKAKEYAETENAKNTDPDRGPTVVLVFPTTEAEPLERARREVVELAKKK